MENYSLSDIASVTGNEFCGGNAWIMIILFALIFGGGAFGNGDYGRFATSASQQEILFGQQFQNLDNKLDRLGNGIADSTFALNNTIVTEGRATQSGIESIRLDMANYACDIKANDTANTQKILDAMAQSKIDSLQAQVNKLELQSAMCGVMRYPNSATYAVNPPSLTCGCGGNI